MKKSDRSELILHGYFIDHLIAVKGLGAGFGAQLPRHDPAPARVSSAAPEALQGSRWPDAQ